MSLKYFKQFNNQRLRELILKKDNVPILEECLNREIELLKKLEKERHTDSLVWRKDLQDLVSGVKPQVNQFLGVSGVTKPTIDYSGSSNLLFLFIKNLIYGRDETRYFPYQNHIIVDFYTKN